MIQAQVLCKSSCCLQATRRILVRNMGYLDAQAGDSKRTAFRKAEKRYKHYKHSSTSARSTKLREIVPPTDLSEVLDFRMIMNDLSCGNSCSNGVTKIEEQFDWPVFTMEGHPGFYFIPEALSVEDQMYWIKESLTNFPQPPNRTNHTALYGHISDLWSRSQNAEVLVCTSERNGSPGTAKSSHEDACTSSLLSSGASADFVRQSELTITSEQTTSGRDAAQGSADFVRQSELTITSEQTTSDRDAARGSTSSNLDDGHANTGSGWDNSHCQKLVDEGKSNSNSRLLPETIPMKTLLYKLRWATLGLQFDWSKRAYDISLPYRKIPPKLSKLASRLAKPAMNGDNFRAEAAIVNYFGCDDMLGGHLDDMEADWSKPIVSISFGCKAIFLLGGRSREDKPTAMFLRSGDVVLMAGPARGCFHGVPRIFVDPEESELPDFDVFDVSFAPFVEYIKVSRINLNIRQVN